MQNCIVRKAKQRRSQVREKQLKPHAANDCRFQCTSDENVISNGYDITGVKQQSLMGQQTTVHDLSDAIKNDRIFHHEIFDIVLAEAKNDGHLEMFGGSTALVQNLVGRRDIVMERRVHVIRIDRFDK